MRIITLYWPGRIVKRGVVMVGRAPAPPTPSAMVTTAGADDAEDKTCSRSLLFDKDSLIGVVHVA